MSISFRRGVFDDNFGACSVQHNATTDLMQRLGFSGAEHAPPQEEIMQGWEKNRSVYEHLTRTAEQFWVAEQDGEIVSYLLAHNVPLNRFVATLFSDVPFGRLDYYINTDPPFLL